MKKKILLCMMALLLILTGCGKSESGESAATETETKKKSSKSEQMLSEEEVFEIAGDLIDRLEKIEGIRLQGRGLMIDPDTSIYVEKFDSDYYLATIDGHKNLKSLKNEIKSIVTEEKYLMYYEPIFNGRFQDFYEEGGEIYYVHYEPMYADGPTLTWNFDDAKINYMSNDRISIYAQCKSFGETMDGQVILAKEDGEWKLATRSYFSAGIPNVDALNYYYEEAESFLTAEEIIEMAGDEDNGWRLDGSISDYFVEIDPDPYFIFWRSDFALFTAVNVYEETKGDLKLVDKIFVMSDGADAPIYPEIDRNGIQTLDYSRLLEEPSKDSLYGYIHVPAYDAQGAEDFLFMFADESLFTREYRVAFATDGSEFYGIIPKYYGTTILVEELDTSGDTNKPLYPLAFDNRTILAVANYSDIRPNTRVTVTYNGESVSFEPAMSLEEGETPVDAPCGDFFLYNPWENGVG